MNKERLISVWDGCLPQEPAALKRSMSQPAQLMQLSRARAQGQRTRVRVVVIHSFKRYLLSAHYIPGIVPDTRRQLHSNSVLISFLECMLHEKRVLV